VVLDSPGGWYDDFGQLLSTDDGSRFERLFGCRIADCQYSRPGNRPWEMDGQPVIGSTLDLQPTTAAVRRWFDHGRPAVVEHHCGAGRAIVLGWEASLMCCDPGQLWAEQQLVSPTLDGLQSPYACEGAIAYRLVAPAADHYFLLNDGVATEARLRFEGPSYTSATDAVTGEAIPLEHSIGIAAHSGRWLRCLKGP
jgi:beta-galactosidase